jgi:hypothetical protein
MSKGASHSDGFFDSIHTTEISDVSKRIKPIQDRDHRWDPLNTYINFNIP